MLTFLRPHGDNPHATHERLATLTTVGLSLYWVTFLWRFWTHGVYSFGINAALFLLALLWLFARELRHGGRNMKTQATWLVPLAMIAASYALYDNPFLKIVSILALPAGFITFYAAAYVSEGSHGRWTGEFVGKVIGRIFTPLLSLDASGRQIAGLLPSGKRETDTAKRAVLGVVMFLALAIVVVMPLLMAADPTFAAYVDRALSWLPRLDILTYLVRALFAILMAIFLGAMIHAWGKPLELKGAGDEQRDSLIVGIVLGGTLLLYALFLLVQAGKLWVGELPFAFADAVYYVKSGFWQLFALTFLNVVLFVVAYRKTSAPVQKLLAAFTVASMLLLASAAQRMALYVVNYGFSYEKLFASYVVLFCGALFVWLLVQLRQHRRADILRFGATLVLWMYAVLTLLPVEQLVFRANVALAARPASRINLYELSMLSPDVLALAERYERDGTLERNLQQVLARTGQSQAMRAADAWNWWFDDRRRKVGEKRWYEATISNIVYGLR